MNVNVGVRQTWAPLIYIEGFMLAALLLAEVWYGVLGLGVPASPVVDAIKPLHTAVQLGIAGALFVGFVLLMLFVPAVFWSVAAGLSLGAAWFAHGFFLEALGRDQVWAAAFAIAVGLILLFLHWQARADAKAPSVDILRPPK